MRTRVRGGTVGDRQAALRTPGVLIKAQRARDGLGRAVGQMGTGADGRGREDALQANTFSDQP